MTEKLDPRDVARMVVDELSEEILDLYQDAASKGCGHPIVVVDCREGSPPTIRAFAEEASFLREHLRNADEIIRRSPYEFPVIVMLENNRGRGAFPVWLPTSAQN